MRKLIIFTLYLIVLMFSGCWIENSLQPKPLKSDPSLESVKRIQTIADTTAIAFEWLPYTENRKVAGYRIYRAEAGRDEKLKLIATIDNRVSSHYVDTDLKPNREYIYSFTLFTKDGRESKGSKPIRVRTVHKLAPLNYIIPVGELAKMAKIIWRPHPDRRASGYIIERSELYNRKWEVVGELDNRLNAEFIDTDLKTNRVYKYRVKTKSCDGTISKPSQVVDVRTKALPKPVTDITASSNLPKEIKLSWRPNEEKDIVGYRIYRSDESDGDFEPIDEVESNSYSDKIEEDGKQMFYKVSAVDVYDQESILNELPIMGNTLFKPKPPKILKIEASASEIYLRWEPLDPRSLKYKIIKRVGSGWSKSDPIEIEVDRTEYTDKDVIPGVNYSYQIIAVDKFGIESLPTEETEIQLRKR